MWAEVRALRDMVVEQRVELRIAKDELHTQKHKVTDLEKENAVQASRLTATENEMTAIREELGATKTELQLQKSKVEEIERQNAVQAAGVSALVSRVTASEKELSATKTELQLQKSKVEEIKTEIADRPKLAFSAGLTNSGNVGPFSTETPLIYSRVFTNIGQAYSPSTGIFTAPVKGVYYFRFTAFHNRKEQWMAVNFYHNGQRILHNSEAADEGHSSISNALILQLEQGGVVSMRLPPNCVLYDDTSTLNTFSGFLLFPM
ncbi:cerebellin-4-like [Centroberyx gerrardi]|uniref:cerebellin-4-like n=1 Tax=Centroberyx gerrardi TaxID=166262 RepID=UPI003AAADF4C